MVGIQYGSATTSCTGAVIGFYRPKRVVSYSDGTTGIFMEAQVESAQRMNLLCLKTSPVGKFSKEDENLL